MISIADLPGVTPPADPVALAQSSKPVPCISTPGLDLSAAPISSDLSNANPPGMDSLNEITVKKKAKTPEEEELERQIEALAVPGYSVHQDGVFTIIRRVEKSGRSRTFPARLARWLLQSDKWLPPLARYAKESFLLAPWRMCILLAYKLIQSQIPLVRLWASARMRQMVDQAIETGRVDKLKLSLFVTLAGLLSSGIRPIQLFFVKNTGILQRKFGAMLTSRLLGVLAKLDYPAATDPLNNKLIHEAAENARAESDKAFTVVADIIKALSTFAGVITQAEYLRRSLNRDNADLFVIGLIANFVKSAQWLFYGDSGVYSGVTNVDYQRMEHLWAEAIARVPEDNLLGMPAYLLDEYNKADGKLGDLWTSRMREASGLRRATSYLNSFSTPAIYAMFAIRASARTSSARDASGMVKKPFTTDMLTFMETATSSLASEIGSFFYILDDIRQHCSDILQYYKVLGLKPWLKVPLVPTKYERQVIKMTEKGDDIVGMGIEFRDVEYQYPDSDRHALTKVNFTIKPGSLVCIVGYNGAGKSTLINLMTRIVDPTDGMVLINGVDAKQYNPADLYSHISCQFQETYPLDFTIREWLHTGDVTNMHDEERLQECLRITGADKVIAKFTKGLDARLGPYPADDTPRSLLKDYIKETTTDGYDPWEADYDKKVERDIEIEDEYDDSVVGSGRLKNKDCAFSPGEWSKLVVARAMMKKSADLRIFDEPTAKLDPIASRAVFDQLEALRGKCTVVHITHDLSACLKADQVILFEDGTNVESGTHEALLATPDSKYRQFYLASLGREQGDTTDEVEKGVETGSEDEAELDEEMDPDADDEESAEEGLEGEVSEPGTSVESNVPMVVHVSWFGEHDGATGESPEMYARIEEIHEPDQDEEKVMTVVVEEKEDEEDEGDEEDDGDDSGFEASSQASFCPGSLPAIKE